MENSLETFEYTTDEKLVGKAQAGDKIAEQELLERYSKLVRFCTRKFFLAGGETEDLIQEGMIGLCQAINTYKQTGNEMFKNFAYLCVMRRLIDVVKKARGKKHSPLNNSVPIEDLAPLISELDPETAVIFDDERRELNTMMSRVLSDTEFKVFSMYMDGGSIVEICEITGKTYKSVDNAVQRSKRKLIETLRKGK